jgi:hypothetical protein
MTEGFAGTIMITRCKTPAKNVRALAGLRWYNAHPVPGAGTGEMHIRDIIHRDDRAIFVRVKVELRRRKVLHT